MSPRLSRADRDKTPPGSERAVLSRIYAPFQRRTGDASRKQGTQRCYAPYAALPRGIGAAERRKSVDPERQKEAVTASASFNQPASVALRPSTALAISSP